jgi:hypothetical protein
MDGSLKQCDHLHKKVECLTRFSPKHDDYRCAPASRIHQILAFLRYSGTKNPARMLILALVHDKLHSFRVAFNQPSTFLLLDMRVWEFASIVLRGRSVVIGRHLCL